MADHGTAVIFTDLVAFFRRVNGKIESLLNEPESNSRITGEIGELKSIQKDLEMRFDKIINMFYNLMAKDDDDHLEVYATSPEGLTVLRSLDQWFHQQEEEMEALVDLLSASKDAGSGSPIDPSRKAEGKVPQKARGKTTRAKHADIKLEPTKEDMVAEFPGGGKAGTRSAAPETKESDSSKSVSPVLTGKEASAGETSTSVSEIIEVPEASDKDPKIHQASKLLRDVQSPRKRLADRLNLTEMSDNEWKLVEGILAESAVLSVEISLSLVELYVQLLPEDKEKGMSLYLDFWSSLEDLVQQDSNREVVKLIIHVLWVAEKELGHLEIVAGQGGTSTATEVDRLLCNFMSAIADLESLASFTRLPHSLTSINEAVELMQADLKHIERATRAIKKTVGERKIRMRYGCVAPLINGMVKNIWMCFVRWSYRGKVR
ncbi:hypothetical protein CDL15_Pgr011244 [Punica granatum]|uniref:Uncharacterized protein n=1 Tax=Punica granatum TaxID=22663 RepID=A0A218WE47_PUNGR|nr:hypothetical protein CDL15_Pgr011244 [Punica granatum]